MSLFKRRQRPGDLFASGGTIGSFGGTSLTDFQAELDKWVKAVAAEAERKTRELPVEQTPVPVLAQRAVALTLTRTGPKVVPITMHGRGQDLLAAEEAVCQPEPMGFVRSYFGVDERKTHPGEPAPAVGCECGFYAVPLGVETEYATCTALMAVVELGGRIIESECSDGSRYYRAQYQRIIELTLPPCSGCGDPEAGAWFALDGSAMNDRPSAFLCVKHREHATGVVVDAEDLRRLGVTVSVGEGSDAG